MVVDEEEVMSIWDHVDEMRSRLMKAFGALVITTLASLFGLADFFVKFLAGPVGGVEKLVSIEVTESIGVYMRVALLSGFILALPIIIYQLMAFIVPGLYDNEKRWLYLAIPIATLLFLCGVGFSYFVMLPTALPFLVNFLNVQAMISISRYVAFVTNMMFWIGISFETPLVMFILAKLHVVNPKMLLKQWRYAVVVIALLAAMITPTVDPVNMGLLMAPLFAIYLLSVFFARLAQ